MTRETPRRCARAGVDGDDAVGQNETDPAQKLERIDVDRIDVADEQIRRRTSEFCNVELTHRGEAGHSHRSQDRAERRNLGVVDTGETAAADHFWGHFQGPVETGGAEAHLRGKKKSCDYSTRIEAFIS